MCYGTRWISQKGSRTRRAGLIVLLFLSTSFLAFAQVVASTTWTAAYAMLAGADTVEPLAPGTMEHPPEYEIRPSDISRILSAELVIYGGYESMVPRLHGALGESSAKLLRIETGHSLAAITTAVLAIAELLGTESEAMRNLAIVEQLLSDWGDALADDAWIGEPVVVHRFQLPLAQELGLRVVGVYGPQPLQPRQLVELRNAGPTLIIDNRHNPVGFPLRELLPDARYVEWINFPGVDNTRTIEDVLNWNKSVLAKR